MSEIEDRLIQKEKYLEEKERNLKDLEKKYHKAIQVSNPAPQENVQQNLYANEMHNMKTDMAELKTTLQSVAQGLIEAKQKAEQVAYHNNLQAGVRSLVLNNPDKYPHLERLGIDEARAFVDAAKADHKNKFGKEPDLIKAIESAESRASNFIAKATGLSKEILDEVRQKYEDGEYEVDKKVDNKKKTEEGDKKEKSKGKDQVNPSSDSKEETQEEDQSLEEEETKEEKFNDHNLINAVPQDHTSINYDDLVTESEDNTNEE